MFIDVIEDEIKPPSGLQTFIKYLFLLYCTLLCLKLQLVMFSFISHS